MLAFLAPDWLGPLSSSASAFQGRCHELNASASTVRLPAEMYNAVTRSTKMPHQLEEHHGGLWVLHLSGAHL